MFQLRHLNKAKSQGDQKPRRKLKKYKPKKDNNTEKTSKQKELVNNVKSEGFLKVKSCTIQEEETFYSPKGYYAPQEPKPRYLGEITTLHPAKVNSHYSQQETDTYYDAETNDFLENKNSKKFNKMAEEEEVNVKEIYLNTLYLH